MRDARLNQGIAPKVVFFVIAGLIFSAFPANPCWSADLKKTEPQVQKLAPQPSPPKAQRLPSQDKSTTTLSPSAPLSPTPSQVQKIPAPNQYKATPAAGGPPKISSSGLSSIFFTKPIQGDFMVQGGQFILQWSAVGNIPQKCVNLDLFKGLSHIMPIAANVCINGYNWQLPPDLFGTGYKVRLRTVDNAYSDDSDPFSILSSLPDLHITNLHIQPTAPDMRDQITVTGVIQNSGHGTSANTSATIRLQSGNWSNEQTVPVPTLTFGPNAHQPFSRTFEPAVVSHVTVTVEVDPQNIVNEGNEGNNSAQISVPITPLPNLKVCVNKEIYNTLGKMNIPILIKNYSNEPVGPTVCRTWINNHGHQSHNVPALGPFESYEVFRSARFTVAGWRSYSATVDYGDIIRESSETDNISEGRIHAAGLLGSQPMPWPQWQECP